MHHYKLITSHCSTDGFPIRWSETNSYILTAGDCHIVSMVTDATDNCSVPAGEEVKVAGGVAVHIIQENCTIAYTKAVRIKKSASICNQYTSRYLLLYASDSKQLR